MRNATVTIIGNAGKFVQVPFIAQFNTSSILEIIAYMTQLADSQKISCYYVSINGKSVYTKVNN